MVEIETAPAQETTPASGTLSKGQEAALRALLDARSLAVAAREAGVSAKTVVRWKREDQAFRDALDAGLTDLRDAFEDRRVALMETAFTTLHDVMVDAVDSRSRVRAAELVFKFFGERILSEERQAKLHKEMEEFAAAGRAWKNQPQTHAPEF